MLKEVQRNELFVHIMQSGFRSTKKELSAK